MSQIASIIVLLCLSVTAMGQSPNFGSLSDGDVETIVKEFSTNLVHTTVTPPTSLGKVFGVEVAVIVGGTESPGIDRITKEREPSAELPYLPHAWIVSNISGPYGITIEVNALPTIDVSGLDLSHASAGVKWSVTDQFFKGLPFDWAVRTYYSSSRIGFDQTLTDPLLPGVSIDMSVGYTNQIVGADNLFGMDFGIIEPYVGFGYVSSKATLTGTSNAGIPYSIFDDNTSESKSLTENSVRWIAGFQVGIPLAKFSVEYTSLFSLNRISAKVGFSF